MNNEQIIIAAAALVTAGVFFLTSSVKYAKYLPAVIAALIVIALGAGFYIWF